MRNMQLMQLELTNFKGIKHFFLDAKGQNTSVFGDNATGKTTLYDAFLWLLFNKDSQGKTDFEIKTLDAFNQPKHGLDHEVEATFQIDSRMLKLKKLFKEKWTKKRGSNDKEFTGHTTNYYIDDIPSKKKEFDQTVSDIISEDIFKLLTSPTYFNEQIKWQERRDLLLEIGGNITDEEVIASNESLSKLTDILSGRSIDDHKKVIAAKRKDINKELELIPARIDEVTRSLPDLTSLDQEELKSQIDHISFAIEDKEAELSSIGSGGKLIEKEKQLRQIESDMLTTKNQINSEAMEKISAQRILLNDKRKEADGLSYKISDTENRITLNLQSIQAGESHAQKLRGEWGKENDKEFIFEDHQTTCYACGQDLPAENVEEAKTKALEHFNLEKAKRLEQIKTQGEQEVKTINELKEKNDHYQQSITTNKAQLVNYQQDIKKIDNAIKELESSLVSVDSDPAYQSKQQETESIREEIKQLNESTEEEERKVRKWIADLKLDRSGFESDLALFKQSEAAQERIEELSQQERKLAAEYEKLEEELVLTESFIKTKVNLLEEKINAKFNYARFKLFNTLINSGVEECCEVIFRGVPYSSMNNAARINVGLDIIATLSKHYGFSAPIFVDNREAVTKLVGVDSQVISLVVSEADKELRVTTDQLEEAI